MGEFTANTRAFIASGHLKLVVDAGVDPLTRTSGSGLAFGDTVWRSQTQAELSGADGRLNPALAAATEGMSSDRAELAARARTGRPRGLCVRTWQ
jgi:hypothetical protein